MYKTTKKDFEIFKKEAEYWVDYFSLRDWEVWYNHSDDISCMGSCDADTTNRGATIALSKEWDDAPDKNEIELTAFHEVCELMLCCLWIPLENFYSKRISIKETHSIIRRLENSIFKEKSE